MTEPTASARASRAARAPDPADLLPPEVWHQPMPSSLHALILAYLLSAFRWVLRDRDACVEMDMAIQYDEADGRRHVMPDILVALAAPARVGERRSFPIWVEKVTPDLIVEIASESTVARDVGDKRALYEARLGIREYVVFDPEGEWLDPRLRIFRRRGRDLVEVRDLRLDVPIPLETVEADLVIDGTRLRLRDRASGEVIRELEEANAELARRDAELAALREELRRLRGDS